MNAPQECPGCGVSLKDPTVPLKFLKYRAQFTRAYEVVDIHQDDDVTRYACPDCGHQWDTRDA